MFRMPQGKIKNIFPDTKREISIWILRTALLLLVIRYSG